MVKGKSTDTIEELELQKEAIEEQLRQKKRLTAEIKLQEAVSKMDTGEENIKEILQACYSYIATHRRIKGKPLPVTGAY